MAEEAATVFGLSAGFSVFVIIIGIFWWSLCIILFFKVWGMTNDMRSIRDMMEEWLDLEHPEVESGQEPAKQNSSKPKL